VPAIVTCIGIYGCTNTNIINNPTSTCNKVVALSAVSEWILSLSWVAYMSTISYDLYHIDIVIKLWRLTEGSTDTGHCEMSNEDNELREQGLQSLLPHTHNCASK